MFGTARNFSAGGKGSMRKRIWISQIGEYRYHAQVLADFDPIKADAIFDQPADVIAESVVSKMCHDYIEPKK